MPDTTCPSQPEPKTLTLHSGRVVQTGAHYSLMELDLGGLPRVRIDHVRIVGTPNLRVGDRLFVGPLESTPTGMTAGCGLVEETPSSSPATSPRRTGRISRVHQTRTFGEIITDDTAEPVFIHFSELCDQPLQKGLQVSFETEVGPKGLRALNAWVVA